MEEEGRTMKTLAQRRKELLGVIYLLKREVDNLREPGLALSPACQQQPTIRPGQAVDTTKVRGKRGYRHR